MQFEREIASIDNSGKRGMKLLDRSKAGVLHPYPDMEEEGGRIG
jgi:hypothetical protein